MPYLVVSILMLMDRDEMEVCRVIVGGLMNV